MSDDGGREVATGLSADEDGDSLFEALEKRPTVSTPTRMGEKEEILCIPSTQLLSTDGADATVSPDSSAPLSASPTSGENIRAAAEEGAETNSPPWRTLFGDFAQGKDLFGGCSLKSGARDWMRSTGGRRLDVTYPASLAALVQACWRAAAQVARDAPQAGRTAALPQRVQTQQRTLNAACTATPARYNQRPRLPPSKTSHTNTRAAGDSSKRAMQKAATHAQTLRRERRPASSTPDAGEIVGTFLRRRSSGPDRANLSTPPCERIRYREAAGRLFFHQERRCNREIRAAETRNTEKSRRDSAARHRGRWMATEARTSDCGVSVATTSTHVAHKDGEGGETAGGVPMRSATRKDSQSVLNLGPVWPREKKLGSVVFRASPPQPRGEPHITVGAGCNERRKRLAAERATRSAALTRMQRTQPQPDYVSR
ncbi:hypothetical protein HPB51_022851 [Rhipicephalus microplus]|uniref:Uncharacterized protein n=1 Tax=Rhipicephalus microplus TaxID=6941 RepID=A0A9J6DQ80_RHIMP|nr:hypothetical protein HPB51_022851 [Rhipicephalus microplus]